MSDAMVIFLVILGLSLVPATMIPWMEREYFWPTRAPKWLWTRLKSLIPSKEPLVPPEFPPGYEFKPHKYFKYDQYMHMPGYEREVKCLSVFLPCGARLQDWDTPSGKEVDGYGIRKKALKAAWEHYVAHEERDRQIKLALDPYGEMDS